MHFDSGIEASVDGGGLNNGIDVIIEDHVVLDCLVSSL